VATPGLLRTLGTRRATIAFLADFIGALLITFVISRGFRRVFKRLGVLVRVAASHAATLALAVLIGGFGLADGGPPQFTSAFLQYAPAVAV
jgi:ACR3 family arsenite efflux pump ArsB